MRDEIVSAVEHGVTVVSRKDTARGVQCLPQVVQCVCSVAGDCIYIL